MNKKLFSRHIKKQKILDKAKKNTHTRKKLYFYKYNNIIAQSYFYKSFFK